MYFFVLNKFYSSYGYCAIHEMTDLHVLNAVIRPQEKALFEIN